MVCTSRTELSLTFDLSCRLKLMLDEMKLSPTSVSINTTNRMLGEALSNKSFVMPQALNDHNKKSFLWLKCSIAKITNVFSELHVGFVCPMDLS